MNWISCKDAYPPIDAMVLVVYRRGVRVAKYCGNYFDMGGGNCGYNLDKVSYWMPIPGYPHEEALGPLDAAGRDLKEAQKLLDKEREAERNDG